MAHTSERDRLSPAPLFQVRGLDVRFATPDGEIHAVRNAWLDVKESECLGIVGESGSGKSQLFLASIGLLAANGRAAGSVRIRGEEILGAPERVLNRLRGSKIGMVFQDPLTSLTPHMMIGTQLVEALRTHQHVSETEARRRSIELLELVRIPDSRRRMRQYPHELSGGMRQRAMIAMAVLCAPDILIADEPTTALDVTVQAQLFEILRDLKRELKTSIILISHDMSIIAGLADRVAIMRDGCVVETGPTDGIYYRPQHPYTKSLLQAVPRIDREPGARKPRAVSAPPILEVKDLEVGFPVSPDSYPFSRRKSLRAVDGVSFEVSEGETLGIVGESGCGKSTLARAVSQLLPARGGCIVWRGQDLARIGNNDIRKLRNEIQIVFQDPLASLDPRRTVGQSIAEPLFSLARGLSHSEIEGRVRETMARVGLEPAWINRYPHEFSGGQNQRVGIARAIIVRPRLLICDEAVSALDVSIQAQVIDLILSLQSELRIALIFISHDLSVVRRVADRVLVLYLGRVVESGDADAIYRDPRHPYTRALLDAVPVPDPDAERARPRALLNGDLPSALDTRASLAFLKSRMIDDSDAQQYRPRLLKVAPGHFVAEFDGMSEPLAGSQATCAVA